MTFRSDYSSGNVPTAADINTYMRKEAGPLRTWTPTLEVGGDTDGGGEFKATTVDWAWYGRLNRLVFFHAGFRLDEAYTANAEEFLFGLPVPAARASLVGVFSDRVESDGYAMIAEAGEAKAYAYYTDGIYENAGTVVMEIGQEFLMHGWYEADGDE